MTADIQAAGAPKSKLRTDIQALRGVAVLLVVLYHASLPGLTAGYLGVDLFFVISGFLITGLIRDGLDRGDFRFRDFYYRRAKRLLPAAYVVLAFVALCAPFVLTEIELSDLHEQIIGSLLFVANFVLWGQTGYFEGAADTKPLLHFWSLAVEEQYYFVMPLLLYFIPRRAWVRVVLAVIVASLALSFYLAPRYPDAAFYLPFTRMWELGLGSIGALAHQHLSRLPGLSIARLPAAAIIIAIALFPTNLPHPGLDALIVCVATLVIILGHNASRWETSFPIRAIARVGDISYSLYLVHWPLLVFTRAAYLEEPPQMAIWLAILLSLALSAALYLFVEEPFRKAKPATPRKFIAGLVTCSIVVAAAPVSIAAVAATDVDYSHILRRNYGFGPECASGREFNGIASECKTGDNPDILVWGDSFAMMWAQSIADEAAKHGLATAQATMPKCPPMADAAISSARAKSDRRVYDTSCLEFNTRVLKLAEQSSSIKLVVLSSPFAAPVSRAAVLLTKTADEIDETPLTEEISLASMVSISERLATAGKKVLIIAPPPSVDFDGGACQERKQRGKIILGRHASCEIPESYWRDYRERTISWLHRVEEAIDGPMVWPSSELCSNWVCSTAMNGTIMYQDAGHLTYDGTSLLIERLLPADLLKSYVR